MEVVKKMVYLGAHYSERQGLMGRAGHFWYFFIFSIMQNDFFAFKKN